MVILQELVNRGLLAPDQVGEVLRIANEKYNGNQEAATVSFGVDENKLLEIKGEIFGIPIKKVDNDTIPFDVLKSIPEDSVRHYRFIPMSFIEGVLSVGIVDPENIQALDALQFIASKDNIPYKAFLITNSAFEKLLKNYEGLSNEVDKAVSDLDDELAGSTVFSQDEIEKREKEQAKKENTIVEEAPVIKIVDNIIKVATEGMASDIHIEPTREQAVVRFRVDGSLHKSITLPIPAYQGVVARIKLKAQLRLDEKRKPQDGSFSVIAPGGRKIDLRISTFPTVYGEKVVIRILDNSSGIKSFESLNLREENLNLFREALKKPYGLILITGPTGSGKSTTQYSMLNELDRETYNVVSLEDPVEYKIDGVSQSQVNADIGYTFASGLRSILRQDPDIIMVGEIRDKETAQLAIQAALTGHLVLATLHTNTAIGAIPRLVDMGVDPYLIAPTLIMTIAQRLVRVSCESAKKKVPLDDSTKIILDKQFADLPKEKRDALPIGVDMYEISPTADCPSGTRGRVGVFEMLMIDKEIQHLILTNPVEQEIYKVARAKGMLTMKEDAILKALKGDIPMQEVFTL